MDCLEQELKAECEKAAAVFLAMEGWASSKAKVRLVVDEMIAVPQTSQATLQWLLNQVTRLPAKAEPSRRLHDLIEAAAAYHRYKKTAPHKALA